MGIETVGDKGVGFATRSTGAAIDWSAGGSAITLSYALAAGLGNKQAGAWCTPLAGGPVGLTFH